MGIFDVVIVCVSCSVMLQLRNRCKLSLDGPLCYFTGGDDYVIADSMLLFNQGQTELSFDVNITDDVLAEPHEVFTLELARPQSTCTVSVARGIPDITLVRLADDDG